MTTVEGNDATAAAAAAATASAAASTDGASESKAAAAAASQTGGGTDASSSSAAAASQPATKKSESRNLHDDDGDDTKMDIDDDNEVDGDDDEGDQQQQEEKLLEATLLRLTRGLPRHELQTAVDEANAVEELLLQEIHELERALQRQQQEQPKQQKQESKEANDAAASRTEKETTETEQPAKKKKSSDEKEGGNAKDDIEVDDDDDDIEAEHDEDDDEAAVRAILESCPFTPLDGYWTISALLGRLRDDMALPPSPLPLQPSAIPRRGSASTAVAPTTTTVGGPGSLAVDAATTAGAGSGGGGGGGGTATAGRSPKSDADGGDESDVTSPKRLVELEKNPDYSAVHDNPVVLLALLKKITSHRSSAVFKKPVKVEDAPGYDARILFPVDLSSIRKQIVARQVVSFRDLHERIGMIAHNCCKYNGRESDYGQVARDFERVGDDLIRQAVLNPQGLVPGVLQQQQQPRPSLQTGGRKSTPVTTTSTFPVGATGSGETNVDFHDANRSATAGTDSANADAKAPPSALTVAQPSMEGSSTNKTNDPPGGAPLPSAPKLPPSTAASLKHDDTLASMDNSSAAKPST